MFLSEYDFACPDLHPTLAKTSASLQVHNMARSYVPFQLQEVSDTAQASTFSFDLDSRTCLQLLAFQDSMDLNVTVGDIIWLSESAINKPSQVADPLSC